MNNWEKYYPTVLYMIVNQFLYRFFIDGKHFLWKLEQDDIFLNQPFSVILVSFIIFPCIVILFLSHLPAIWKKEIIYLILWGAILCGIEGIMYLAGRISYHNGWNFCWSVAFNFSMVIMLRFHYRNPFKAWFVSFLFTAFFLIYFHVPLPKH
ncbi:CBO0543 family protein [Neobacillus cucumis]|uniref:CBO0543 family protein n=1 Tax=Neobacillus cucumis TaxID=1740721 RepID=UPI001FDC4ED8|nr:hypothetical protein [Neobacillus cucumis]